MGVSPPLSPLFFLLSLVTGLLPELLGERATDRVQNIISAVAIVAGVAVIVYYLFQGDYTSIVFIIIFYVMGSEIGSWVGKRLHK